MEVCIEHSQIAAVLVEHLVGLDVRMINGDILVLLECDTIEFVGQTEHTVYHLRQFEVGAQHLSIQVIFLHLQLVGIEPCVPRLHAPLLLERLGEAPFQFLALFDGSGLIGIHQIVQQSIHIAHV